MDLSGKWFNVEEPSAVIGSLSHYLYCFNFMASAVFG
jgi:hypothetical protein